MFTYSKIYYYRYAPATPNLPIFDQLPLVLPLLIRGPVMLAINLHWVPGPLRYKLILLIINMYNRTPGGNVFQPDPNIKPDTSDATTVPDKSAPIKNFHLWYQAMKANPSLAFATMAVRKYYIGRCMQVQEIEPQYWSDLPLIWNTRYRPRYMRKLI